MSSSSPFFSVIIPTYNRRSFLKKAIDSVLSQTFDDFEIVVIDDGSTDDTQRFVNRYQESRIKYLHQGHHGVAHARNRGLEKAKGEWIAFLDSDDWWMPEKLARARIYIGRFPGIRIFHTEETWYRQGMTLNQRKIHQKPTGQVYPQALKLCCISISTAVVHQSIFATVGTFDESLPACEDYDFWLRGAARFPVKLIPAFLTEKEGGRPDQLSSQWGLDRYRILSLMKMLSSDMLNPANYEKTRQELLRKAELYISGCRKRGRWGEAERYQRLIAPFASAAVHG